MRASTVVALLMSVPTVARAQLAPGQERAGWNDDLTTLVTPILDRLPHTEVGFRTLLGEPWSTSTSEEPDGSVTTAFMFPGANVWFRDGGLYTIGICDPSLIPTTSALRIGMPRSELFALLGEPSRSDVGGDPYWFDKTFTVTIVYGRGGREPGRPPDPELACLGITRHPANSER